MKMKRKKKNPNKKRNGAMVDITKDLKKKEEEKKKNPNKKRKTKKEFQMIKCFDVLMFLVL